LWKNRRFMNGGAPQYFYVFLIKKTLQRFQNPWSVGQKYYQIFILI
jgi:hypothetical protein